MPHNKISNGLVSEDWSRSACCHCQLCNVPRVLPHVRWEWQYLAGDRGERGDTPAVPLEPSLQQGKRANCVFFSVKKKAGEIVPSTSQWLPVRSEAK